VDVIIQAEHMQQYSRCLMLTFCSEMCTHTNKRVTALLTGKFHDPSS